MWSVQNVAGEKSSESRVCSSQPMSVSLLARAGGFWYCLFLAVYHYGEMFLELILEWGFHYLRRKEGKIDCCQSSSGIPAVGWRIGVVSLHGLSLSVCSVLFGSFHVLHQISSLSLFFPFLHIRAAGRVAKRVLCKCARPAMAMVSRLLSVSLHQEWSSRCRVSAQTAMVKVGTLVSRWSADQYLRILFIVEHCQITQLATMLCLLSRHLASLWHTVTGFENSSEKDLLESELPGLVG